MVSRGRLLITVAGAALVLAGCQTRDRVTDSEVVKIIRESPTMKAQLISDCRDRWYKYKHQLSDDFVDFIGVSRDKTVETYCTRLYNGVASGRITEADIAKMTDDYTPPAVAAVLKGR